MSPIAVDPDCTREVTIPDTDSDGNDITTADPEKLVYFKVRELPKGVQLQATKMLNALNAERVGDNITPEFIIKQDSFSSLVLSRGLVGWRNFRNQAGNEIAFKGDGKTGSAAEEDLNRLDLITAFRLALVIFNRSNLEDRDQKN